MCGEGGVLLALATYNYKGIVMNQLTSTSDSKLGIVVSLAN